MRNIGQQSVVEIGEIVLKEEHQIIAPTAIVVKMNNRLWLDN